MPAKVVVNHLTSPQSFEKQSQVTHNARSTAVALLQHALRRLETHDPAYTTFSNTSYCLSTLHIRPPAIPSTTNSLITHIHNFRIES